MSTALGLDGTDHLRGWPAQTDPVESARVARADRPEICAGGPRGKYLPPPSTVKKCPRGMGARGKGTTTGDGSPRRRPARGPTSTRTATPSPPPRNPARREHRDGRRRPSSSPCSPD
jgi:hypothetical protein